MRYAYINDIYSSRKIEEVLRQNIHFMWDSGMSTPDHNMINHFFKCDKLRNPFKEIFTPVVQLSRWNLLNLEELYTDGTKIEANVNR